LPRSPSYSQAEVAAAVQRATITNVRTRRMARS
jgi:hypothetical protein